VQRGHGVGAFDIPHEGFTEELWGEDCSIGSLAITSEETRWLQLNEDTLESA
jgi:hypothetical protein